MAKNSEKLILVTGATGHQGGAVFRHLRERGFTTRLLTRDPNKEDARSLGGQGVAVAQGDLDDIASITRALEDVYGVYSVQNMDEADPESEVRRGINLADAANRSGIATFVYGSVAGADQNTGIPHFETKFKVESHLRGTGLRYSILRPVFFMENWLGMKEQIAQGTLASPLSPDKRLQMIAVNDIGVFAAHAFEHIGRWEGKAVEIAGDELSMTELADVFSRISGTKVQYQQVPWDQFEQQAGAEMTKMYHWFEDVGYHVDISSCRDEYSQLLTFERWMHANWQTNSENTEKAHA